MLKSFRYILFPFSILYGLIIRFRNCLFDKKIIRSAAFNFPIICVGNLALGGTGKTPMTEYLVRMLSTNYKVATLSRGYKRKTKGFALADENTTAVDIGDEPMQLYRKFPQINVSVAEERLVGIPQLLHDCPETEVIILDDAFQHREVRAGMNILLTDYNNLYTRDFILPAGDLRDVKSSSKRAQIIIVTKCPSFLTEAEKKEITNELNPEVTQSIFFTKISYDSPYHLFEKTPHFLEPGMHVLLVCGIANPRHLQDALTTYTASYEILSFDDHHIFSLDDLDVIKKQFHNMHVEKKIILTTEKDGVRLAKYEKEFSGLPIYVLPMRHAFLFEDDQKFEEMIESFVKSYRTTGQSKVL